MSRGRRLVGWVLSVSTLGSACSSGAKPTEVGIDASGEDATGESTPSGTSVSHARSDARSDDAGVDAGADVGATSGALDGGATGAESMTDGVSTATKDASVIVAPMFEQLTLAQVCERVLYLDGEVVDVDLSGLLRLGEWAPVTLFGARVSAADASVGEVDARSGELDAGVDDAGAGTCEERFAAYVAPCAGSVLVVSAPTLAFGEGPTVGGERVGFGCWESECLASCLPTSTQEVGVVRVRVSAPVNARYDAARAVVVGDVRVNGVDVEAAGLVEILTRQ